MSRIRYIACRQAGRDEDRQKKLQKAKEALAERLKAWREERGLDASSAQVEPAPRYDDVFSAGARWLDSLAGEPLAAAEGLDQCACEGDGRHVLHQGECLEVVR